MSRKSLEGAYCTYPDDRCALEKTDCSDTFYFRSSLEITMQGRDKIAADGGFCLIQGYVKNLALGQCGDGTCSPNKESCISLGGSAMTGYEDIPFDGSCLLEETNFGKCDERCSWSANDCDHTSNESWTFPYADCTCDKVRVGGCMRNGQVYCAVSSDACDNSSVWLTPLQVESNTNHKCFLCPEDLIPEFDDDDNMGRGGVVDDDASPSGDYTSFNYGSRDSGDGIGSAPGKSKSHSHSAYGVSNMVLVIGLTAGVLLGSVLLYRKRSIRIETFTPVKNTDANVV